MTRPDPKIRKSNVREEKDAEALDDAFDANEADPDEGADELSEETGIDLTDASELDADNVPADEERDRVVNGPD